MTFNRRQFLRASAAASILSAGMMGVPTTITAQAMTNTSGYKALVCVFLFGGLDGHDLLLPYDTESYGSFTNIRQTLLNDYGQSRARDSLLPLSPNNASAFGSRQFALPPEMPQLKSLFDQGRAAFVANVGPLLEPVTADGFATGSARVPSRLFSHNDQQSTWQASAPEGAQLGWGGLFADAALAAGANSVGPEFTSLATSGVGPFLTGNVASPYQISLGGSAGIALLNDLRDIDSGALTTFISSAENQFRASQFAGDSILAQDMADKFRKGIDANTVFDQARATGFPVQAAFPETSLGAQLKAVADTIAIRSSLSASRQIFFVGTGGFDTHSSQAADLPGLLAQIDGALSAFDTAMTELNLSQDVTTFTASDFGRTLAVNGDGTDHGWGSHSIVMGGAVKGRNIYGDVPEARFGHDLDGGGGRLIPSLAVEHLADPLGRWWGLSDADVASALPNLWNFDRSPLDLFL